MYVYVYIYICNIHAELSGSQFPECGSEHESRRCTGSHTELRVSSLTMGGLGASSGAKQHGSIFNGSAATSRPKPGKIAKRSFLRARRRALSSPQGGTWYRGRWLESRAVQSTMGNVAASAPARDNRLPTTSRATRPAARLKILTYNIGGLCTSSYDVFMNWLVRQQEADIIVLTEVHWGLGRDESSWTSGGWHAMVSPDPAARFAGVAVFVRATVCKGEALRFCAWVPGRVFHVRILGAHFNTDVLAVYQWSWNSKPATVASRHHVWLQLGRLIGSLPKRNIVLLAGDLNCPCTSRQGYVGLGVPKQEAQQTDVEDWMNLIVQHDLCVLNTWGSARVGEASTFSMNGVSTQIDFVCTRRSTADSTAKAARVLSLDLVPWRCNAKHKPVQFRPQFP